MNKFNFLKNAYLNSFYLLCVGVALTSSVFAQNPANSGTSAMSPLNQSELDAINRQPIAQSVRAKDRVQGTEQRRLSYELKEENGTHVREYREGNKPVDIEVESSFGTRYHMSTPTDQVPTIRDQTLERVPAIRMPF